MKTRWRVSGTWAVMTYDVDGAACFTNDEETHQLDIYASRDAARKQALKLNRDFPKYEFRVMKLKQIEVA